jgi:hypothetical protein
MSANTKRAPTPRARAVAALDALPLTTLLDLVLDRMRVANARGERFDLPRTRRDPGRG